MKKILFIDDDRTFSQNYLLRLTEHFNGRYTVHICYGIDDGLEFIRRNPDIACCVLDIMMPPPKDVPPEVTDDGQLSGIWLLRELREHFMRRNICVFVMTNKSLNIVETHIEEIAFPDGLIDYDQKVNVSAKILPLRVQRLLDAHKPGP